MGLTDSLLSQSGSSLHAQEQVPVWAVRAAERHWERSFGSGIVLLVVLMSILGCCLKIAGPRISYDACGC